MEGIGFYILIFILYAISALMKKKQKAARKAAESSEKEGPADNKMPDLVRELFGLPPEGEVVEEEPRLQETVLEEELPVYEEEPPVYEEEYQYVEERPEEEDLSHLTYDDLETVTEEAYVREEFPHDLNTFVEDKVEDHHAGQKMKKKKRPHYKGTLEKLLTNRNGLQHGIIISEILGPPKALKKRI